VSKKNLPDTHPYPNAIIDAQQTMQIMQLRVAGWSVWQIADHLGVSTPTIHNQIVEQLASWRDMTQEMSNELRELELQRLDEFLRALWPKCQLGNPRAIETALKVSERRAKLMGLDAPEKREVTLDANVQTLNHNELVAEYTRLGLPLYNETEVLSYQLPESDAKKLVRRHTCNTKLEDDI
jgi:hypothetical protein